MLSAENGRFPSNRCIAGTMNALFAILADPKPSDDLQTFDDPDQVLLPRRFRPFTQPRERRSVSIVANRDQRLQSCNCLMFQAPDQARVSTDDQETHLQIDALKQVKCGRIYQEKASGAKADRPELMKLLDNARKGDVVIVWKLDRLARSIRQLLDTTALLNERGVELYSLTENINTTTPS